MERSTLNLYYLSYNSRYLTATPSGIGYSTTAGTAFAFSNGKGNAGTIFFLNGGTPYYLYIASTTSLGVTNSSAQATIWTASNSGNSSTISATYSNRTYYIYCSNQGAWSVSTNSRTITSSSAGTTTITIPKPAETSQTTASVGNGVKFPETYFPLATVSTSDFTAADKNSGYIVSGSNSETATMIAQTDSAASGKVGGDVRVSQYDVGDNLAASMNGASPFQSSSLAVAGCSYRTNGNFVHITDPTYDDGSNGSSGFRSAMPTTLSYTDMGLEKYADSRSITSTNSGLQSIFGGNSDVYGIHFMDASISMSNICTANSALIDAVSYTDYQLPRDSIDFRLRESGFINFFGATMFANNDAFFSIHEIQRNDAHEITDIKEISKVFGVVNASTQKIDKSYEYIYQYSDDSYSKAKPANYTEIFDTAWITNTPSGSWIDDAIYYFEVPANAGEYALGSVPGKTGAYLIYLDLAANAMEYDYTNFYEYAKTTTATYSYPLGVAIVHSNEDAVDAKDSASIAIPTADTVVVWRNDSDTIYAAYAKTDETVTYLGYGLSMYVGDVDPPTAPTTPATLSPVDEKTVEIQRVTTISYNYTLKRTEVTEITATITDGGTPVYTGRTSIDGGANWENLGTVDSTIITDAFGDPETNPTGNDSMIVFTAVPAPVYENGEIVDITVTILLTYERDEDTYPDNQYQKVTGYAITLSNPSTTEPYEVTVEELAMNGDTVIYTITINGTTVTGTAQVIQIPASSGA